LGASFTNVPGGTAHWIFTGNGNYNDGSGDASIIIQSWTPKGFYRPVDMPTTTALVWNSIKGGSTVPLKFNIFAGITEQKSTSAVNSLSSQLVACTNGINNEIDQTELPTPNRRYQPSL